MNRCDLSRLKLLNERYGFSNMTGFKIVDGATSRETVLRHIEIDLLILNSSDVEEKRVFRVIMAKDHIDICSVDNGTPVTYIFSKDAGLTPQSVRMELEELCRQMEVIFEERN